MPTPDLRDRFAAPPLDLPYAYSYAAPRAAYPYHRPPTLLQRLAERLLDWDRALWRHRQGVRRDWGLAWRSLRFYRLAWRDRLQGGLRLAHLRLQRFLLLIQPSRPFDKL